MNFLVGVFFLIVGAREFYLSIMNLKQEDRSLNEYEYDSGTTKLKGIFIGLISLLLGIVILFSEIFLDGIQW